MKPEVEFPFSTPKTAIAQAKIADAIAHVHEAVLLAEEQEMDHFLNEDSPCEPSHSAADAAVRNALLQSEDAMISVLQALPGAASDAGPLVN